MSMRNKDVIYLLTTTYVEDELLNQISKDVKRKVYGNKLALGANEFESAGQLGLQAAKAFKIYAFEYNDEDFVEYNDQKYHVYRIAENGDKTTLYCERAVGDGSNQN